MMDLSSLKSILESRLVCTAEFEIYKHGGKWYLFTVLTNDYSFRNEIPNFDVDIEELKSFVEQFKQEHNIQIKLVDFD